MSLKSGFLAVLDRLSCRIQRWTEAKVASLSVGALALVVALTILVYGFNLGGARALTYHELYVACGAKQMAANGDLVLPRIGDRLWLEKPPLSHWLVLVSASVLGRFDETSARLPSVLAGVGVVLLVAALAGRFYGESTGLVSGIVQCTLVYSVTYARLAEADMTLALIVVAAITAFIHLQSIGARNPTPRQQGWAFCFWALIGFSNLAKGPLFGAAVILAPCIVWMCWQSQREVWLRMWSPTGMVAALLLFAVWPTLVLIREPAALNLWVAHTIGRSVGNLGYTEPWWYYLTTWPWQLLPWTFSLVVAAGPSFRRAWRDPAAPDRFLWCWALAPFIMLSLSRAKHHHYLIHSLPALTPIVALGIQRHGAYLQKRSKASLRAAWLITFGGVPLIVGAAGMAYVRLPHLQGDCLVLAAGCVVILVATSIMAYQGRARALFTVLVLTLVSVLLYVHARVLLITDRSRDDRSFLSTVEHLVPANAQLFATGGPEVARHIFYVQRAVEAVWDPKDIAARIKGTPPVYVIAAASSQGELQTLGRPVLMAQSAHTRLETGPQDRCSLFRIDPPGYQ